MPEWGPLGFVRGALSNACPYRDHLDWAERRPAPGGFTLFQALPAPDEKLDFTVQIADADGDTANASFSIGIDGTGINDNNHVDGVNA